ncbi:arginase family protein [Paraburkholderia susongensis]|nr:arginase family protein [Paraburkholderia susongensis]
MGVPSRQEGSALTPRACVLGVPFDCGTHPFRVGSREGPDTIRRQSRLIRPYFSDPAGKPANPIAALGLVDAGNVNCFAGDVERSYPLIEQAMDEVIAGGMMPITMGGDGAVTLPQLRAVRKRYPDLAVLHIDAHTDTYDLAGFNTATTFTRASEEGLVDVRNSFHVGARGTTFMDGVLGFGRSLGYNIVSFAELDADPVACVNAIRERIGQRPVYLCFDMDIFDPSCAPGVCTPEWGGLNPKEGIALLRSLAGLNFVAFDVNTVSPAQDIGETTAFLAASVLFECCALAAQTPAR